MACGTLAENDIPASPRSRGLYRELRVGLQFDKPVTRRISETLTKPPEVRHITGMMIKNAKDAT
jgi:hypothetical protein